MMSDLMLSTWQSQFSIKDNNREQAIYRVQPEWNVCIFKAREMKFNLSYIYIERLQSYRVFIVDHSNKTHDYANLYLYYKTLN